MVYFHLKTNLNQFETIKRFLKALFTQKTGKTTLLTSL